MSFVAINLKYSISLSRLEELISVPDIHASSAVHIELVRSDDF